MCYRPFFLRAFVSIFFLLLGQGGVVHHQRPGEVDGTAREPSVDFRHLHG